MAGGVREVGCWHEADIRQRPLFGRYGVESGHNWLAMSISAFDPTRTSAPISHAHGRPLPNLSRGSLRCRLVGSAEHEVTRVHYGTRRRGTALAIRGTHAAAGDGGRWLFSSIRHPPAPRICWYTTVWTILASSRATAQRLHNRARIPNLRARWFGVLLD